MFTRIVKMEFIEAEIPAFLANFDRIKETIRSFPGCCHLELYRDKNNPEVFFTYSKWEKESDLEHYRNSDFFKKVWATTKIKFRSKAQAYSVDSLHSLN
jgi:quinol monooxygenase YgiN